jgi:lipooligosaccharide transport system permease protein
VWRRHFRVYQRTWLVNFLPPITEPLVYLLAFGYGLSPLVRELTYLGQPLTYPNFIGPSMIAVAILFQAFFEGAYGSFIRLYYQRTWHALLTAPLTFSQVYAGDLVWATTRGIISGVITGVVTVLLGFYSWTGLWGSLPIMILGSLLFAGMGLLTAGTVSTVDQINVPIFTLVIPMFVLCGTYFPRENLPELVNRFAMLLPLSSMVDLVRWPLGLPSFWPLEVIWLLGLTALFVSLGWQRMKARIFG